jgi:hypothetical protein
LTRCEFRYEDASIPSAPQLQLSGLNAGTAIESCLFTRASASEVDIEIMAGGSARGLMIVNPRFVKPDEPLTREIKVAGGVSEFQVLGGSVLLDSGQVLPVRVLEDPMDPTTIGRYLMTHGVGRRLRLPRLTTAEIMALPDITEGDLVYNRETHMVMVHNGTTFVPL